MDGDVQLLNIKNRVRTDGSQSRGPRKKYHSVRQIGQYLTGVKARLSHGQFLE